MQGEAARHVRCDQAYWMLVDALEPGAENAARLPSDESWTVISSRELSAPRHHI